LNKKLEPHIGLEETVGEHIGEKKDSSELKWEKML